MEVKAKAKNIRISPTKVRLVIDIIRGKNALQALSELEFIHKKASQPVLKLLKSAISNAKNNYSLDDKNLYISRISADCGPIYKRVRFRARGRRDIISKRTTHISIVLSESKEKVKEETKLTQQFIQEEIKKEEAAAAKAPSFTKATKGKQKEAKTQREKAAITKTQKLRKDVKKEKVKKPSVVKALEGEGKKIKEEKPKVISKEKKKFFEIEKRPKVRKKESFFKKFFRRKSV